MIKFGHYRVNQFFRIADKVKDKSTKNKESETRKKIKDESKK